MEIKCYTCECSEEIYEDDTECPNCRVTVDENRFKKEPVGQITECGQHEAVDVPEEWYKEQE